MFRKNSISDLEKKIGRSTYGKGGGVVGLWNYIFTEDHYEETQSYYSGGGGGDGSAH